MGWVVNATSRSLDPRGKTRYPMYSGLGGPQGRSGRLWKMSSQPGFDPWTVQHVASRYTDYTTPAHMLETEVSETSNFDSEFQHSPYKISSHFRQTLNLPSHPVLGAHLPHCYTNGSGPVVGG